MGIVPYAASRTYPVGAVVTYLGVLKICKMATAGNLPSDGTYWDTLTVAVTNPTSLSVAALTEITNTAPGTADYAFADTTATSPWGFANHNEANTLLSVVKNLQQRLALAETALLNAGIGV